MTACNVDPQNVESVRSAGDTGPAVVDWGVWMSFKRLVEHCKPDVAQSPDWNDDNSRYPSMQAAGFDGATFAKMVQAFRSCGLIEQPTATPGGIAIFDPIVQISIVHIAQTCEATGKGIKDKAAQADRS